ncbi:saccharopine dehydrogenase NADP-binding domain-containing protein [Streptomyces sp. NPDC005811]|uniref:saccharopine dehydrogenase family protein n=1 Tax=Streptomyces sp. NPDC005811 TaxID=3154565 RepID=UPI00340A6F70
MSHPPLRVIAVGGAGAMGRWAVRTLAQLGTAAVLTVADIDENRARRLAQEIGGPCRALALDATDPGALSAAFADYDVVVNTMGPFATFVRPVLEAALDARCHYLDINDDWQPTVSAFGYDADARMHGLHIVVGLGGSPGVTNLCAVLAAERLDRVDELYTGWKVAGATAVDEPGYPAAKASAAVEHWLHQCSGPIRVWSERAVAQTDAVRKVTLDFPGRGKVDAYTMGHPEPVTLPRRYPGLRTCLNLQSGPTWLLDHLRHVGQEFAAGRVGLREGAEMLADPPRPAEQGPRDPLPVEWGLAVGIRDGRRHTVAAYPRHFHPARMGGNTGVPLAVGVELLRRGLLRDTGVHAPETAVDPLAFFDVLAPLIDPSLTGAGDLIAVEEVAA